jgi:hypothetical protein
MLVPAQFGPLQYYWSSIASEAAALPRTLSGIHRVGKTHAQVAMEIVAAGTPCWTESWGNHKRNWLTWGLALNGTFPLGDAGAPITTRLLRDIRGLRTAAFSLFKPGVLLTLHRHPEMADDGLLTYHLGLHVPRMQCYLWSGGDTHEEANGHALIFPGGDPHWACNASPDHERIILYVEFDPRK